MGKNNVKIICARKGCGCEATREVKRGKRGSTWLCDTDYTAHVAHKRTWRQNKIKHQKTKAPSLTCEAKAKGKVCGEPNTQKITTIEGYVKYLCSGCHQAEVDRKLEKSQYLSQYYTLNKPELNLNRNLNEIVWWFQDFSVMKTVAPNFDFYTFCDQESRRFLVKDLTSVGLIVENEHSFISTKSLRQRTNIDLRIPLGNKVLYVETKSTKATFSKEETLEQVNEYQNLWAREIQGKYRSNENALFISWSPSGDNSDMTLRKFYEFLLKEITRIYNRLRRLDPQNYQAKFKTLFPFLRYMDFVRLCKTRFNQLSKAQNYCPESPYYDFDSLKEEVADKLLTGQIVSPRIDLALLDKSYGQK